MSRNGSSAICSRRRYREKHARSIRLSNSPSAKLPLAKDVDDFQFKSTPINENLRA